MSQKFIVVVCHSCWTCFRKIVRGCGVAVGKQCTYSSCLCIWPTYTIN